MSRLNRSSSDAVKSAVDIAVVHYPGNTEGFQFGIAAWNNGSLTLCSDGSGMLKLYPSRAKALDAIRRLNSSFNASNVKFYSYPYPKTSSYGDIFKFFSEAS